MSIKMGIKKMDTKNPGYETTYLTGTFLSPRKWGKIQNFSHNYGIQCFRIRVQRDALVNW